MMASIRFPVVAVLMASALSAGAPLAAQEEGDAGSVSLVVDYGNGARTSFGHIPWFRGMNALDVLELASGIGPGLQLRSIHPTRGDSAFDIDCSGGTWNFWANERPLGARLWVRGAKDLGQKVGPGDTVVARRRGPADDGSATPTVALVIDYSDGVTKSFANLPWHAEIDASETLLAARGLRPGLEVEFAIYPNPNMPEAPFIDRADHEIGFIRAIDGVAADDTTAWVVWVGSGEGSEEIRTRGQFGGGVPRVNPGEVMVVKRVARDGSMEGPFHEPTALFKVASQPVECE